jgi:hypothetical protein
LRALYQNGNGKRAGGIEVSRAAFDAINSGE